MLIDINIVNTQIDYNLLLGHSYMYAMWVISSTVFWLLMFPHDGKIMNIDQLMYFDMKGLATPKDSLPTIDTTIDSVSIPSVSIIGLGLFSNAHMAYTFFPFHLPLRQLIYHIFSLSCPLEFWPLYNLSRNLNLNP